jgi:arsenical pump membrane protein
VALSDAAQQAWPPFALVVGLLLIGLVAHADGLFERAGRLLDRLPGPPVVLLAGSVALVAVVTAVLNLDTAVVFLTPVLVLAARLRGVDEQPFLYAAVYVANASSLYLPGSNLTNLLVLARDPLPGGTFAARLLAPALAATVVTSACVWLLFRRELASGPETRGSSARPGAGGCTGGGGGRSGASGAGIGTGGGGSRGGPGGAGGAGIGTGGGGCGGTGGGDSRSGAAGGGIGIAAPAVAAAAGLTLALAHPALPVLTVGVLAVAAQVARGRLAASGVLAALGPVVLALLFLASVALGALARVWDGPAQLLAGAGRWETAAVGSLAAITVNNLPAAVLLSAQAPPHPRALLIGLDLGPNLAVTGSLSAYLWIRAARQVGARPSIAEYSRRGIVLAPLAIIAALAAACALPGA